MGFVVSVKNDLNDCFLIAHYSTMWKNATFYVNLCKLKDCIMNGGHGDW